jgi:predicted neutral ceramidase superfamily lipid hydrolase
MRLVFDPITKFLDECAWLFWALLWLSLSLGIGQEEMTANQADMFVNYNNTTTTIIATILLWGAVVLQTIRQVYYSHTGHILVKIGRWLILCATSIFAFRMTFMLIVYGGTPSSYATLVGVSLLAVGLSLNSLGMMQQSYFQEHKEELPNKWYNSWINT